jgi:hypothetical protein
MGRMAGAPGRLVRLSAFRCGMAPGRHKVLFWVGPWLVRALIPVTVLHNALLVGHKTHRRAGFRRVGG